MQLTQITPTFLASAVALAALAPAASAQSVLFQAIGAFVDDLYAQNLANAYDVEGDGYDDVILGTPLHSLEAGLVEVRSGRTGAIIHSWSIVGDAAQIGSTVAGLGDINGDGEATGFTLIDRGVLHIVSGTNLATLAVSLGPASWAKLGFATVAIGDITGDGKRDIAASAPFTFTFSSNDPGRFFIIDPMTSDAATAAFGVGTPGTMGVPNFVASAPPRLGTSTSFDLDISSGAPNLGAVVAGRVDAFAPLYGGTLYVVPMIVEYITMNLGGGSLPLLVPQDHTLSGQRWILQGLQVDPGAVGGLSFSRPLEVIFVGN